MRRIVLFGLSTVSVLVLLFGYRTSTSAELPGTRPPAITSGTIAGAGPAPAGGASPSSGSSGSSRASSSSGSARSGSGATTARTVTGDVASTQWGPVQVELTVKAGTITAVSVVEYPTGNPRDEQINGYALPILIRETTSTQSAHIDMVSGATVTSTGYLTSLQSALDKAGL